MNAFAAVSGMSSFVGGLLTSWAPGVSPEPAEILDDKFGQLRSLPTFGSMGLHAILILAGLTFAIALAASRRPRLLPAARAAAYATCALVVFDLMLLAYAFVTHDFRLRYVARYSDRSMPTTYLLTALWGGQDGSLLWWIFLLSVNTSACVYWMKNRWRELQPYVIATLMAIIGFFGLIMAFSANPFAESIAGARVDGEGLNPLLQNFYMIIHPPSLYTGFVGCSVPFAFGVAALASGRLDEEWLVAVRRWMIFAWVFLSIGNTLGMLWAYEELGWGGYWAWDPVENAAFMPWLTASAYVHSTMVQERRRMLKIWNIVLIAQTFFMTIWGTFLTRSGMIKSVHAFAQSSIGIYFTYFMVTIAVVTTALVVLRLPELKNLDVDQGATRAYREKVLPAIGWTLVLVAGGLSISVVRASPGAGTTNNTVVGAVVVFGIAAWLYSSARARKREVEKRKGESDAPSPYWLIPLVGSVVFALYAPPGKMLPLALLAVVVVQGLAGYGMARMRRTFTGYPWGDYVESIALFILLLPIAGIGCIVYWITSAVLKPLPDTKEARARQGAVAAQIDSVFSREAAFVANNWVLVAMQLFVGITTAYPLISTMINGEEMTVGPKFYNTWMIPLGLILFALMGIGPLLGWRKTSEAALRKAFRIPLTAAAVVVLVHVVVGPTFGFPAYVETDAIYSGALGKVLAKLGGIMPVLATALAGFNIAVILQEYSRGLAARRKVAQEPFFTALFGLVSKARRRYGGYVVHSGIVVMFLGFAGSAYKADGEFAMRPNEVVDFHGYQFTYLGPRRVDTDPAKMEIYIDVAVKKGSRDLGVMHPARFVYRRQSMPTSEVAIRAGLRDDIYIAPGSVNPETKLATIHVYVNPLTSWIWLGAMILILGAAIATWPDPETEEVGVGAYLRSAGGVAASLVLGILLAITPARAFAQTGGGSSLHAGNVEMKTNQERSLFSNLLCMCGSCDRLPLSTCACDWADGMRKKLSARLGMGESIESITESYVKEHGNIALNVPRSKSVWMVPLTLVTFGAVGAVLLVRNWTKKKKAKPGDDEVDELGKGDAPSKTGAAGAKDEYDAKLDAELSDLDR